MDDSRFGAIVRAIRRKKRLTHSDVAAAAGVSQQTVSDVENGRLGSFAVVRDICRVLGVSFSVTPSWRGGDFDRLGGLRSCAARGSGRECPPSPSLVHPARTDVQPRRRPRLGRRPRDAPGFRGAPHRRVKTEIKNVGDTLRRLDVKRRVVPRVIAAAGDRPRAVGTLLAVTAKSGQWRVVRKHESTFAAALSTRGDALRRRLEQPVGHMSGLLFVRNTGSTGNPRAGMGRPHGPKTGPGTDRL